MANPFYTSQEKRPRALWRIVLNALTFVALVLITAIPVIVLYLSQFESPTEVTEEQITNAPFVLAGSSVASLLVAVLVLWLFARFVDKRRMTAYGLQLNSRDWWRDLIFGAGLGALLMVVIFLVEQLLGWVEIVDIMAADGAFWSGMALSVVIFLCVGIYEELIFRGYQMLNLAEGLNLPQIGERGAVLLAWAITSIIFGVAHSINPNATLVSTLYITIAGIMLGAGYALTGSLAIPIGLHITWNFFQTSVFGFPVSGMERNATFIAIEQSGPDVWTGGAFGPEAGLIGLFAMILGIVLIMVYTQIVQGTLGVHRQLARYTATPAKTTSAER